MLKKPELEKIPTGIQSHEINYVHKLFEAYGSVDHTEIRDKDTLNDNFRKHFERQRTCFYSAESLRVFTEKSFYSNDPYIELRNQILIPVDSKILIKNLPVFSIISYIPSIFPIILHILHGDSHDNKYSQLPEVLQCVSDRC